MSAFKKDWINQFKSERSKEESIVRSSYSAHSVIQNSRRRGRVVPVPRVDVPEEVVKSWPLLMTVKEVAEVLRFKNPDPVIALIRGKILAAKKIGREWRVPRAAFVQYLSEMESHVA